jgi:hypothetical protein
MPRSSLVPALVATAPVTRLSGPEPARRTLTDTAGSGRPRSSKVVPVMTPPRTILIVTFDVGRPSVTAIGTATVDPGRLAPK